MIADIEKLSAALDLGLTSPKAKMPLDDFPLRVPEGFVKRIKPGDIKDPLLLQILPQACELKSVKGFNKDPIFEKESSPVDGLIHKYRDRVLLLVTDSCAISCRFCFRRHSSEKITNWQKIFSYIKNDAAISEVILSGGDPLMLGSAKLKKIIDSLAKISHIKRVRIHSRVPIVMPELVNSKTIQSKLPIILVVHCNHPNEINDKVKKCLALLKKQKITIFNQTVLLRGINDDSQTLASLSERLFDVGVVPYYLHMLDKVKGAAHFCVDIKKAKKIHLELQEKLPGYLVPKLVVEVKNRKKYV